MNDSSTRALTIFHLDDERGFRGGERQLMYLAAALRADGHTNVICCRSGTPLEQAARDAGFDVLTLPFAFEFDLYTAERIARAARGRSRAIVHAHTGHTVGIAAACQLLGGPRAIAHRRGFSPLRGGLSRWFKYDRMARVVAVSQAIAETLRQGGLNPARIVVVPDCLPVTAEEWRTAGCAAPRFAPADEAKRTAQRLRLSAAYGIDPSGKWIGNLAALVPLKDHATLIAAADLLLQRHPRTVLLIAGEGPERDRLQADIDRRGLAARVRLLGQYDASALFAAIDIFALSSNREGMGSVLLEAAASGVPVVATSVGGIPEVVEHEQTGLVVEPSNPAALAGALGRLINDEALAQRLAAAARERLPHFGLSATLRRMMRVYEEAEQPPR